MMKIAFVSDAVFPWHVGGLEAVELAEAKALANSRDYEVHFFCMRWPGMPAGEFRSNNITYHPFWDTRVDKFYRHGRRSIRTSVWFSISMARIYLYRFDFVYANMFPILHVPLLKLYCKLTRCELILDVVEVWENSYWTKYLGGVLGRLAYAYASYFLDSANAFVANSSITMKGLLREGINKERIRVFAPILEDRRLLAIKSKAKVKPRVIYYGRLIKEKRFDKWLDAIREVHARVPRAKGLIIGTGPERAHIARMIKEKGLSGVVELRPFYENRTRLFREVADSSTMLLMSEREGLSVSALEALSLGVPVVLPDYSPVPDEVKSMCVVSGERGVAAKIESILKSRNKETFIYRKENLKPFSSSSIAPFFASLFRDVWVAYGRGDKLREHRSILPK